jgi:hypothetical protein
MHCAVKNHAAVILDLNINSPRTQRRLSRARPNLEKLYGAMRNSLT